MWIFLIIVFFVGFIFLFGKIRDKKILAPVTNSNRGTKTERDLVSKLLKHGIPAQTIFHDLYVKKNSGDFSQIDLVVVTKVGVIVFEIKDYSGWIYGNGNYSQWTQVLAFGKNKYKFYNPIMQNNKHIIDLKKQLKQFDNIPFFSIVVFYGDCVLKDVSFVPNGTFLVKPKRVLDVMKLITEKNETAPYTNKADVVNVLKKAVQNGENVEAQMQHIENIKNMLGRDRIFD